MNKNNLKDLLKKLQAKNQPEFLVLNAPREFLSVLWDIGKEIKVRREIEKEKPANFTLTFVRTLAELKKYIALVLENSRAENIIWFAWPKKTSKTYKTQISAQHAWEELEKAGFQKVSHVSIDNDWSAVRFKKQP